jgi:hypothetical protein
MQDLHKLKSHPVFHYLLEKLWHISISEEGLVAIPPDFVRDNKA